MTIFLAVLRTLVGLVFVVSGAAKLFQHQLFAAKFAGWGVPAPDVSVLAVGALEIVCGGLFALGALTRPVGMLLATIMVAAAYFARPFWRPRVFQPQSKKPAGRAPDHLFLWVGCVAVAGIQPLVGQKISGAV